MEPFPEVEAINKQIDKNSKGTHGVSFMVHDEFDNDTSYYHFEVGDNSHEERYINVYDFLLEKKTGQIKAYDHLSGAIMSLGTGEKQGNSTLADNDYAQQSVHKIVAGRKRSTIKHYFACVVN